MRGGHDAGHPKDKIYFVLETDEFGVCCPGPNRPPALTSTTPRHPAAKGFDGTWIHNDTEYDALGRVVRVSEPYYSNHSRCDAATGQSKCYTQSDYDVLGRVTRTALPDGSVATVRYSGYTSTHTNGLNQTRSDTRNALGETVNSRDDAGGVVEFRHDAQGNLTAAVRRKPSTDTTAAPASIATTMTYDLLGRKTAMTDPDKGTWSYRYNALGELTCQQSAAGHFSVMTYDGMGRRKSRKDYRARSGTGCATLTEEFCHDTLNRLTRSRLTTQASARSRNLCTSPLSELSGIDR